MGIRTCRSQIDVVRKVCSEKLGITKSLGNDCSEKSATKSLRNECSEKNATKSLRNECNEKNTTKSLRNDYSEKSAAKSLANNYSEEGATKSLRRDSELNATKLLKVEPYDDVSIVDDIAKSLAKDFKVIDNLMLTVESDSVVNYATILSQCDAIAIKLQYAESECEKIKARSFLLDVHHDVMDIIDDINIYRNLIC